MISLPGFPFAVPSPSGTCFFFPQVRFANVERLVGGWVSEIMKERDEEMSEEEENRLPTVPPPAGARDPYSAPTKVAETTENVLEAMKIAAERGTPMKPVTLPPSSRPPSSSRPQVREVDLRKVSDEALKAEIRRLRHDEADAEVGTVLLPVTSNDPAPKSTPSGASSVFVPEGEPRRTVKTIPPANRAPEPSSVGFWILVGGIAVAVATVGVIVGLYFFLS